MEADEVRKKPAIEIGESLDSHSIAELDARILALRAEIERTQATIKTRNDVRGAAEALFKPRNH